MNKIERNKGYKEFGFYDNEIDMLIEMEWESEKNLELVIEGDMVVIREVDGDFRHFVRYMV